MGIPAAPLNSACLVFSLSGSQVIVLASSATTGPYDEVALLMARDRSILILSWALRNHDRVLNLTSGLDVTVVLSLSLTSSHFVVLASGC